MDNKKFYFPNLNGIRFIAASLVLVHHIEQIKSMSKIDSYWDKIPFINIIGKLGVFLFFVLSGFLITYLLLLEERTTNKINIRKFYLRRILRIWPLYFLIIFLAFAILPNIDIFVYPDYGKDVIYTDLYLKIFFYVIMLPNLVLTFLGMVPFASHTWSIGTEEQFYLIWPFILRSIKKYRILLMLFIVLFYFLATQFLASYYSIYLPFRNIIEPFWTTFRIDSMAIGGLFGIILFQKNSLLKFFLNNAIFYITLVSTILLIIYGVCFPYYIHGILYSFLFGIIILNFTSNKNLPFSLENKILNYLGKISYGIYMFHPIAIVLALYITKSFMVTTNWILYPLGFLITIIFSGTSFKYFENYFLKLKK